MFQMQLPPYLSYQHSIYTDYTLLSSRPCEQGAGERVVSSFPAFQVLHFLRGLRTVLTNLQVFLRGLLNMREKQIITSAIEIQKEN